MTPCIQILSKYKQYSLLNFEKTDHTALKYTTIYEHVKKFVVNKAVNNKIHSASESIVAIQSEINVI